jgi:hypothetical protein
MKPWGGVIALRLWAIHFSGAGGEEQGLIFLLKIVQTLWGICAGWYWKAIRGALGLATRPKYTKPFAWMPGRERVITGHFEEY